jgi:DivIVA domain-containing protein
MDQKATAPALSFRKRWFGYDPGEVDAYLAKAVETHEAVRAEVERLRAAEPLARVGGDVANLLTTFAETVSSMRDAASVEIDRLRAEASEEAAQLRAGANDYAAQQRTKADEALAEARDRARDEANAIVSQAQQEMAAIAAKWSAVECSLNDAAAGITTALASMQRISGLPNGNTIDIADHRTDGSALSSDEDADQEGGSVLPSLAAKMWQSRQSRAAGSEARLQYLLPRLGSNQSED